MILPELKKEEVLIVGLDDSNHAGISKAEIVAAVFSHFPEDSLIKSFPNHRNFSELEQGLGSPERDYRFCILTSEQYRHNSQNLVSVAPNLIKNYLEFEMIFPRELKIYFDGRLEKGGREYIRRIFSGYHGIERVIIDNFIKKNKLSSGAISKRMRCPSVVYFADVLSNNLYRNRTFEELSSHPKLVSVK